MISPKNNDVRPTTDMVKESIFNMLQGDIIGAKFLDMFAGSGAIGIEAISRGAAEVVFVDKSRDSISIIRQNLAKLCESATVICGDYADAALRLKNRKFDIIFLDPPYEFEGVADVMQKVLENNVIAEDGIVVVERLYDKNRDNAVAGYVNIKSKKYGITAIDIYEVDV